MLKKLTWNVGSGHRRSSGREAHTLTGWTFHAAIIDMLESGLSLPDCMLDQVANFRRAERFLLAFTLSANQPGLFRLERFRAKWMPLAR
ncbi:hypothetical protein GGQ85_000908 [Nitrobacter vulgaris]|jgi:hypothetical protein|nr:hypothetical protein [Nitrobacter vulgaris]